MYPLSLILTTSCKDRCLPTFQMSVLWPNHTTHGLSISVSICITICILIPHSGLSIAPANLHSVVQASIKLCLVLCSILHTLGKKRPPEGIFKLATRSNTRMTVTQSNARAWHKAVCGHGPTECFRQQVTWLLKGRKHHGGIYSGDGSQVSRSCKVRQQKREEDQALRKAVFLRCPEGSQVRLNHSQGCNWSPMVGQASLQLPKCQLIRDAKAPWGIKKKRPKYNSRWRDLHL